MPREPKPQISLSVACGANIYQEKLRETFFAGLHRDSYFFVQEDVRIRAHASGTDEPVEGDNQAQIGRLAQLVRAPALHAGGHKFESCTAHH